jgi:hypothetical protein
MEKFPQLGTTWCELFTYVVLRWKSQGGWDGLDL